MKTWLKDMSLGTDDEGASWIILGVDVAKWKDISCMQPTSFYRSGLLDKHPCTRLMGHLGVHLVHSTNGSVVGRVK